MNKSFFKKTIIALPMFASSAWAGGERIDSPEDPSSLHLVLRLRTPDVDSETRFVTPDTGSQTLVSQPNKNASHSDDSLLMGKPEQSQTLSKPTPADSDSELDKVKQAPVSDTSLPESPEVHDEESIIRTDIDTLQPEQIMVPDPLSDEKEQLRLKIAALETQNQAFQEEIELHKHAPNITATAKPSIKKHKVKHKGIFGQIDRFVGHIERRKF